MDLEYNYIMVQIRRSKIILNKSYIDYTDFPEMITFENFSQILLF